MTENCKAQKQDSTKYVECGNCTMQAICQPLANEKQSLDLTGHYLSRRVPTDVTKHANVQAQKSKGVLFKEGQDLTAIFSVCSGVYKLYQNNSNGTEKVIGFRFPGELMAEDAIFIEKYNYSATAIGESSVCEVSVEQLTACGRIAPELQQNLIQLLTKQSFEQQRNSQALIGQKSTETLLVAFFLNICERNAKYSESDSEINLVISRNDIASFLGIRRETLSRLIIKLQQEKLISLDGKKLQLLSRTALENLINH